MAAAASTSTSTSTTSSSSSSSSTSPGPHRRRHNDIERALDDSCCSCCGAGGADACDDADGAHAAPLLTPSSAGRSTLLGRRKRAPGAAGHAWMRAVVLCLLGLVAVVGFLGSSHHRGGGAGGDAGGAEEGGGRLVQKVEVAGDADVMGWTEENLTAMTRRPPNPPIRKKKGLKQKKRDVSGAAGG